MTVLYTYIMYIQCIILSFCISLSISFFMYIFIDFVLLLYLKSKSKWIIIYRVYKNYVCNTSNSHRLFLYMNLLEKFRTWYNNLDNCTTVNQNMQNKKRWRVQLILFHDCFRNCMMNDIHSWLLNAVMISTPQRTCSRKPS